jgi:hypothetical protein
MFTLDSNMSLGDHKQAMQYQQQQVQKHNEHDYEIIPKPPMDLIKVISDGGMEQDFINKIVLPQSEAEGGNEHLLS